MLNILTHKNTILKELPIRYLDRDVISYLNEYGRNRYLDDDVIICLYDAYEEDYVNGCSFPPLWFVRLFLHVFRPLILKRYYNMLKADTWNGE